MAQFLARAKRCTPSAWMMLITVPNCVLDPVPNRVLSVGHFIRAQMGHFSLAPRELAAIVLKCLEKKPERRFASVRTLHEELSGMRRSRFVL
jgi:hypothetical protein